MKKELFDELLESVREGGAILRGERDSARVTSFEELNVRVFASQRPTSPPRRAARH
jgi:hypothetical protein